MSKRISTDELLSRTERLAKNDYGGRFTLVHGEDGYRGHFGTAGKQIFGPTESANELLDIMVGTTLHDQYADEPLDVETESVIADMERDEEPLSSRTAASR